MIEVFTALTLIVTIVGLGGIGIALLTAYLDGGYDGEGDLKYPSQRAREHDYHRGARRTMYELGYSHGAARFRRADERRAERAAL